MNAPSYIPSPELYASLGPARELVSRVSSIFSERLNKIEEYARYANDSDLFAQEYWKRKAEDESQCIFPSMAEKEQFVLWLLQKYSGTVASLLRPEESPLYDLLDPSIQQGLLWVAYYEHCLSSNERGTIFNGTKQYCIDQNTEWDVSISTMPYYHDDSDVSRIFLYMEQKQSIHMCEETYELFAGLCLLYMRGQWSLQALKEFAQSLGRLAQRTPNVSNLGRNDSIVGKITRDLSGKTLHYDGAGQYEHTWFSLPKKGGRGDTLSICDRKSLAFLCPDSQGKIVFWNLSPQTQVFEIPLEDVLGVMTLLHRFPGRSGANNSAILSNFLVEYSDPISKK